MTVSRLRGALLTLVLVSHLRAQQQGDSAAAVIAELRSGRTADALRDADLALQSNPRDARMWTLKGVAAKQTGQTGTAINAFKSSLQLEPSYLPALEGVCNLLYATGASDTSAYLTRLLALLPNDPTANGMAAILAYKSANYAEAAPHFAKAEASIAGQQSAMDAYADTLLHLGRDADVSRLLRTLVERWPADRNARFALAVLEARENQPDNALRTLDPLLGAEDEPALSLASALHESRGETPAAVDLLRRAIAADPKDPQNYIDFGALSFDHASARAGIVMLNAGLEQLPNESRLYVARGVLYMQTSETNAAERDFARANQLDPSQTFGFEAQGLSEIQRHNLPEALRTVQSSLKRTPNNAYLNYLAAEILKEQGAAPHSPQAADALTYARRAVALDPTLLTARDLVGALDFADGDLPGALEASRAALHQDPTDQESLFRVILVLRRTGDAQHEVPSLVERLQTLRATAHTGQQRLDRYRLVEVGPKP